MKLGEPTIRLVEAVGPEDLGHARSLFWTYAKEFAGSIAEILCHQGFEVTKSSDEQESPLRHVLPCDLESFGLIPELIGRLPVIATLDELSIDDLARILTEPNGLLKQYMSFVTMRGATLEFTDEAVVEIARAAHGRGLGARGLRSVVEAVVEDVLFDVTPGYLYSVTGL